MDRTVVQSGVRQILRGVEDDRMKEATELPFPMLIGYFEYVRVCWKNVQMIALGIKNIKYPYEFLNYEGTHQRVIG